MRAYELFEKSSPQKERDIIENNVRFKRTFLMKCGSHYRESVMESQKLDISGIITPGLRKLQKIYEQNGYEVRIVGGAVRDLLLGKTPKDIDLATDATPEETLELLGPRALDIKGFRLIDTGLQHGTLTVVIDGEPYEITTLRVDTEHTGRHATVAYTRDWETDAARRDLTFNAMSLDFDGNLYDYFGGIEDLKAGKARFVGDASSRIKEDYLRILRYFRFQGRTAQPNWDGETLADIKDNADGLKKISGERIWMELGKILSGNYTKEILEMMIHTNVAENIGLPKLDMSQINRIKANTDDPATILGGMLKAPSEVDKLFARWRFSAPERDLMKFIAQHKDKKFDDKVAKEMWTNKKIPNEFVLELAHYFGRSDIIRDLKHWQVPVFPVSGNDLMKAGMRPGPNMGKALATMERKWKDSDYQLNKEELLRSIGLK